MSQKYVERAQVLLNARLKWEQKQRAYYAMRHDGLPRLNKPFPTASDAHYPLCDLTIRRMKPFWMGQVTSGDKLFQFTSLKQQLDAFTDAASDWMDFTLTQRTDLLRKTRIMLDYMLLTGRGIIKATIDPLDDYNYKFEVISPFFLLMPQEANGFEDADEWIHIRQFTVESYKRLDERWDTSSATVSKIRGQPSGNLNTKLLQDRLQQGITYSTNQNQILVWEHWIKTKGGHTIHTYSPMLPDVDLRKPYGNPYKCDGHESIPFFGFQMEVVDEGWYAPRGLAELLAPMEQYMTKLWNEKADAITFYNRPLYTGDKEIVNSANYRWQPGEYIPGQIKSIQQGAPPMSFDEEIGFAQGIAEQQSQSPDFGIVGSGDKGQTGGKPRTATENQRIAALQQAGGNDNAMMFREDWSKLGKHCWAMACQFKQRSFAFYASGKYGTVPEQALHDQYLVMPDGSPDGWNRQARWQKSVGAIQTYQGNPNVDMEVLTKDSLNAYDGTMALKAFVPTNLKGANEYEDEALIISSLIVPGSGKPSFPATVKPNEDQPSRIKAIVDWMHAAGVKGTPIDPQSKTILQQRLVQRLQILQQQQPQAAAQIKQSLQNMEQQPVQGGQPPSNGVPPPSNGSGSPSSNGGPAKESISINYKDAPPSIQRQMEQAAGFQPATDAIPTQPQLTPPRK